MIQIQNLIREKKSWCFGDCFFVHTVFEMERLHWPPVTPTTTTTTTNDGHFSHQPLGCDFAVTAAVEGEG